MEDIFVFPMSFTQQRFWFLEQLEPGTALYTIPAAVRIEGRLDSGVLTKALNEVVTRHESLRTTFAAVDGQPRQIVQPALKIEIPVVQWDSSGPLEEALKALCTDFDLARGPLLRAQLVCVGPDEHYLLLAMHHIVSDGWSIQLLVREVGENYAALVHGRPTPHPPLELQYADYACWQREWMEGEVRTRQLQFWRDHLAGAPALLELPSDRPRPAVQSFRGARVHAAIPAVIRAALRPLGRRAGATEFMTFFAAFNVLLARLANATDVVVGTPFANRHRSEVEPLIGPFVNTLALRARLDHSPSFDGFLAQVRDTLLAAQQHQDLPFELLVDEIRPERNISHNPLFQVMFVWESTRAMSLPVGDGITVTPVHTHQTTAKFDLTLFIEDSPTGLNATWEYSTALFDSSTIARYIEYFQTLLASIAARSDRPVGQLDILPDAERELLLVTWNATAMPLPAMLDFAALFEEQVLRTPDAIAAADSAGSLTFAELNAQANQLAHFLRASGLGSGSVAGLYLRRSCYLMVAVVAVLKSGAAYVPLDVAYPAERLRYMQEDSGAAVILTQSSLLSTLPPGPPPICLDDSSAWRTTPTDNLAISIGPEELAYVLYTSGSTGRPKGAEITHRGLANYLLWALRVYRIADGNGAPVHSSISFDATITGWLAPLLAGATVTLVPEGGEVEALGQLLQTEAGYSLVKITPAHLEALSHLLPSHAPVPGARAFVIGGEALLGQHLDFWQRNAPAARMINEYGPTETVVGCCVYDVPLGTRFPGPVPIGRPIDNTQLYVLDAHLQLVPLGSTGELFIGGAGVARGYRNRAELTAERFIPNPFGPGRLYRTSDLVRYLPDGNLVYLGRMDDQVKIRGFRVELGEIESALVRHPGVREAVLVVDSAAAHKRLLAYYVPVAEPPTIGELRSFLAADLPDYMIPALFIAVPEMPLTGNGKIDRRALPSPGQDGAELSSRLPVSFVEQTLATIWRDILRVESIGIDDNFFERGGDSIMSIQVVSRARAAGLVLTPKQIFQHQSIAALAAAVPALAARTTDNPTGPAALLARDTPLTPIQHWFFEQRLPAPQHYNQSVLLRIPPDTSQELLEQALRRVVAHHDALRTRFDGERQFHADADTPFATVSTGFDLGSGPLIALARVAPDRLRIAIHHLAVDAVSWRILLEDLATCFAQLQRGDPTALATTSSFQSWALSVAGSVDRFAGEAPYWRAVVGTTSRVEPPDSVSVAEQVECALSAEETEQLLRVAPAAYQTHINELLLTALALAIGSETIDVESHGREPLFDEIDLTRAIGWFTAIYPVRFELPSTDLASAIRFVKQKVREIPHGGVGYGVLRYIARNQDLTSAARVKFNYLGRVDDLIPENPLILGLVTDAAEADQDPRNPRSHPFEVTAVVLADRLRIAWAYSGNRHSQAEMEELANRFRKALAAIIAHCAGVVQKGDAGAESYPLSPMQQGMLFQSLLAPGSGTYVEQMAVEIRGRLDVARFQAAWNAIVAAEPVLLTEFSWQGLDQPVQRIRSARQVPWQYEDWQGRPGTDAELEKFLEADRQRGFDLSAAPLLRCALFRCAEEVWQFTWTYHHLLLDGWSRHRVVHAVVAHYATGALPAQTPPYRKYIDWLRRQDAAAAETFWRTNLAGAVEPTPLTVDLSATIPGPAARVVRELPPAATAELERFARAMRVTLNTLVQGAWALLLSRYSGRSDVLFGATVAGRPADLPGAEDMLGLFINTLPIRVNVEEDCPIGEWLGHLQKRLRDADEFAYVSLIDIHGWSEIPRGVPLFESVVVFENFPAADLALASGGLAIAGARFHEQTNIPLILVAAPGPSLYLALEYDTARFAAETVERMAKHLGTILAGLTGAGTLTLGAVPILDAAERRHLLEGLNGRDLDHRGVSSRRTDELFVAQAQRTPEAVALVDSRGSVTYAEVDRRSNQVAHHLIGLGIGPEDIVGVSMERSSDVVVAILGIWKAGAAYVPLDPSYPQERIAFMVEDSGAKLVLTHSSRRDMIPGTASRLYLDDGHLFSGPDAQPLVAGEPNHLAYLIYTSGSTGLPKGVMIEHRSCVEHCLTISAEYGHSPNACLLLFVPLSFDQSVEDIFPTLLSGAKLILPRPGPPPSIAELLEWIDTHSVTMLHMPTAYWHEWTAVLDRHPVPGSLTAVKVGGELAPLAPYHAWVRAVPKHVRFINGYGPTEVTVTSHVFQSNHGLPPAALSVPIGRTLPNTLTYVLDSRMRPMPFGVPGELYIGGARVGRGYHQRPELTAERFLPNPFGPGRVYRTGDLARYLPDGSLEFLGRIDQQVKIRGFRIELGEIETRLNHHPGVRLAAVAVHPSPSGPVLVAYVCARAEALSESALSRFVAETLPEYMVPGHFIWMDTLPLNPSGKIDRRALPAPGDANSVPMRAGAPPRDRWEQSLVEIWQEVLGCPVSRDDNFFSLGGQSLTAIRLMARIDAAFGVQLPLSILFEQPTVTGLAEHLRQSSAPPARTPLVPLQSRGTRRPLFLFHGGGGNVLHYYGLSRVLEVDQPTYALEAPGLDGDSEPLVSVEAMAECYLREIRRVQPTGPYLLGGHSLGGQIAFEAARQLYLAGESVARIFVLDTFCPGGKAKSDQASWPDARWMQEFIEMIGEFLGRQIPISPDSYSELSNAEQFALLHARLEAENILPAGSSEAALRGLAAVFRANNQVTYSPQGDLRLPVPITLIRGRESSPSGVADHLHADPLWGWSAFTSFPVDLHFVPGEHISMMMEPNVLAVGAVVRGVLA